MATKFELNPFTGKFDIMLSLDNPLQFKGSISANTDFPLIANVQNGWFYRVLASVTDNAGATYTNTGQSFINGDEIVWNGTNWTILGNLSGVVTAVTGTLPISSTGGTTPNLSISQASTSTNGYLSSTDWNTFNNKVGTETDPVFGTWLAGPPNVSIFTNDVPYLANVVEDTTPQLGGDLDGQAFNITTTGMGTFANVLIHQTTGYPLDVYTDYGGVNEDHAFGFDPTGYFLISPDGVNPTDYTYADNVKGIVPSSPNSLISAGLVIADEGMIGQSYTDILPPLVIFTYKYLTSAPATNYPYALYIDDGSFTIDENYNLATTGKGTFGQVTFSPTTEDETLSAGIQVEDVGNNWLFWMPENLGAIFKESGTSGGGADRFIVSVEGYTEVYPSTGSGGNSIKLDAENSQITINGNGGYTGDLNDSNNNKIADVVGGIITATYY